jgi:hypothetical protein
MVGWTVVALRPRLPHRDTRLAIFRSGVEP